MPSPGSLPSRHDDGRAPGSAARACAGWSSMPTACSSSRRRRCRGRSRPCVRSTSAASRSGSSRTSRSSTATRSRPGSRRAASGSRPDRIITAVSATATYAAAAHAGRPLFVIAATDARREFDGHELLSRGRCRRASRRHGGGGRHRRRRGRSVVPEPGRRLPPRPRRRRAPRDASQPMVADPARHHPRRRGLRGRAGVRHWAAGPDARQALPGRLPPGGRRAARGSRRAPAALGLRDGR